jgi:dynactin complex subunit
MKKSFKFFKGEEELILENTILWERIDELQDENERLRQRVQELILTLVGNSN